MGIVGIVRKFDELGRIVIPKELRHQLGLSGGSNVEIILKDDTLVLKKFSPVTGVIDRAEALADSIYETFNISCLICDNEQVITVKGLKKELLNKPLDSKISDRLAKTKTIIVLQNSYIFEGHTFENIVIMPIVSNGFVYGGIILVSEKEVEDSIKKALSFSASYISKFI